MAARLTNKTVAEERLKGASRRMAAPREFDAMVRDAVLRTAPHHEDRRRRLPLVLPAVSSWHTLRYRMSDAFLQRFPTTLTVR